MVDSHKYMSWQESQASKYRQVLPTLTAFDFRRQWALLLSSPHLNLSHACITKASSNVTLQLGAVSADHKQTHPPASNRTALTILFALNCGHRRKLSMLLALLYKLMSVLCIEYIFLYLCTEYVDAAIEFAQAYIQVLNLIRSP